MTKTAQPHHHHPRTYEVMEKAQGWVAKIAIVAALAAGAVVVYGMLTTSGNVTW